VLKAAGLTPSTSEALRMIAAGGVRVNGEKVGARDTALHAGDCVVLQVGKRKFAGHASRCKVVRRLWRMHPRKPPAATTPLVVTARP
jgi:ribosome-associated protein YbcJ (S4-like RNA binding protein)